MILLPLVVVHNWGLRNQDKSNPEKSQFIIFLIVIYIVLQDVAIPTSSSFNILGIDSNCKLSRTNHIRNVCNRASSCTKSNIILRVTNFQ